MREKSWVKEEGRFLWVFCWSLCSLLTQQQNSFCEVVSLLVEVEGISISPLATQYIKDSQEKNTNSKNIKQNTQTKN